VIQGSVHLTPTRETETRKADAEQRQRRGFGCSSYRWARRSKVVTVAAEPTFDVTEIKVIGDENTIAKIAARPAVTAAKTAEQAVTAKAVAAVKTITAVKLAVIDSDDGPSVAR